MPVTTTLNFNGQTEAALQFYGDALGAETVFLMRFRDSPERSLTKPGMEDLIFHATFRVLDTNIMASDVGYEDAASQPQFAGFSLAVPLRSPEIAQQAFAALAAEGRVVMPLAESAFALRYGIVVDRFGVSWKIIVTAEDE